MNMLAVAMRTEAAQGSAPNRLTSGAQPAAASQHFSISICGAVLALAKMIVDQRLRQVQRKDGAHTYVPSEPARALLRSLADQVLKGRRLMIFANASCKIIVDDGVVDEDILQSSQASVRKNSRMAFIRA